MYKGLKMNSVKVIFLSILFSGFLFGTEANKGVSIKDMPTIVSVDWLKKHIDDPKVVIVDLQPEEKYLKGHIKGAVSMPGHCKHARSTTCTASF